MPNSSKDRLILALSAQLQAERETRGALMAAIANGPIDREVMLAILGDPVPVVTSGDLARANLLAARRHLREAA
jgi:hypothetical protein